MNSETKKAKKLASVLGLVLDGGRLDGVVLKRVNGALQKLQSFSAQLTLDPLTAVDSSTFAPIKMAVSTSFPAVLMFTRPRK